MLFHRANVRPSFLFFIMTEDIEKKKEEEKEEPHEVEEEKSESEEKPSQEARCGNKAPLIVIVAVVVVILVGGVLLFLPAGEKEGAPGVVPLTDEQIIDVAYQATESIILTAERNLEYEVEEDAGSVKRIEGGYITSFPISNSEIFSEFLVFLDSNLNLLQVGYSEDELANPQAFLKIASVSKSQLEGCASLFLEQEVLANWINTFNESFPGPGRALIFNVSHYISCENITFPYSVSIGDGIASVTVLYNISATITFETGRIGRGVDIPFEDIQQGVEVQVSRRLPELNETSKLLYLYRVVSQ